ncbi:GerAB/ArcD/ProY family transporter [Marinisporobacter balticus]|uniref:Spore germination protein n=1 Tax=Marinisporobacter balticus TaxID=2018667 RepID=A0A4R2L0X5_9FIRM|nr:endospore germination permease [Marinisporobacter balticus]TCO77449.1 spore germination protein [Marinisporobacter balticus]
MNESLTNRQIAFIIFGVLIGYGVMELPKNVAENAGTGGWLSLLIATAITIIFAYMITYLSYVYKNKTIYEYSERLTGKFITHIFMIIYIFYYFLGFTMITRVSCETIKLTILLKTPIWVLSLLFSFVIYYAVIKRLRVIARVCEIYGIFIIIAALLIHTSLFTQGKLINLRPFFVLEDLPLYFKSTLNMIFPFLGIEILTIIPFAKKNHKKVFKYITLMIVCISFFYIMIVESCISVMGVDEIVHYNDALYATIRRVDIPAFQVIRRLDGIFLIAWIMAIFCTITIWCYGAIVLLSKLFKKIHFNLLAFIVVFMGYIVSQMPTTYDQVKKVLDYMSYYGLVVMGIIPTILFFITKVKKYDKKMQ